jgi:adenylate cyclase
VRGASFERAIYGDFNLMVKTFRKKIAIQKYVSDSTNKMIDDLRTGEYTKDAMRREITVLFSDIRGFTSYAERHDPMTVVDTLNTLFDIQVDAIVRHAGDIDKFIGDEVMATFGEPGDAFKAAMEIQKKVASFNKSRKQPLHVGIGIHTGEAVIGALGSGDFYNWTAIGNSINIGRRLCSAAGAGEVLVSTQSFAGIRTTRPHKEKAISAKGISKPLPVSSFVL